MPISNISKARNSTDSRTALPASIVDSSEDAIIAKTPMISPNPILLVEDNPSDVALIRRALAKGRSRQPARRRRRTRANPRTRRIPIIILTSSKEEQDLAVGYDLGANSYIRNPVDFQQFAQAIEHLGLYWLVLNQPPPKVT